MLIDLFRLEGVTPISRHEGRKLVAAGPPNALLKPGKTTWSVPSIYFVLVGHFLPADFARRFGRLFYDDLFESRPDGERSLVLGGGKVVGLASAGGSAYAGSPVVEYAQGPDGSIFEIRLAPTNRSAPGRWIITDKPSSASPSRRPWTKPTSTTCFEPSARRQRSPTATRSSTSSTPY
jgi:hypothetical protein